MTPVVVPATHAHMDALARGLRDRDRIEIIGMGSTVADSLRITWRRSLLTRTVLLNGAVVCVGGVGGSPLGGVGQPWMLSTTLFPKVPIFMVKEGLRQVATWLSIFPRLESYVDARYQQACGYLEVLGFQLDAPEPLDTGMMVRRYWMET